MITKRHLLPLGACVFALIIAIRVLTQHQLPWVCRIMVAGFFAFWAVFGFIFIPKAR